MSSGGEEEAVDDIGPDPLADDAPLTPPPATSPHSDPQGSREREVKETLEGRRGTLEDEMSSPQSNTGRDEDIGPSRFLDQLRKQTPFLDLAERYANSMYPGRTLDVRMAQLRADRPRFVERCLRGDAIVRALIVIVLILLGGAAALKTLWPIIP